MRAAYQVLVFPYIKSEGGKFKYCIFKRDDLGVWQGIAGGGEDGETPIDTAIRESFEEAGISTDSNMTELSSVASIPVEVISGFIWGEDTIVIPEHSFGVELKTETITLNDEHPTYEWVTFEEASKKLEWDSNRTALWELNHRLLKNKLTNIKKLI